MKFGRLLFNDSGKIFIANSRFTGPTIRILMKLIDCFGFKSITERLDLAVFSLPLNACDNMKGDLPEIEVLIVAHNKDYARLGSAIKSLAKYSRNSISKVTLIVQNKHQFTSEMFEKLESILKEKSSELIVLDEKEYLTSSTFNKIKVNYPNNHGWMLQQLLKCLYVAEAKSPFVLVWDADTILCCRTTWVNSREISEIFPSWHKPFGLGLKRFDRIMVLQENAERYSFTSHHLLMSPRVLNFIVEKISGSNRERLIESLLYELSRYGEYDYYAKFALENFSHVHRLAKWSNLSVDFYGRGNLSHLELVVIKLCSYFFKTISVHIRSL